MLSTERDACDALQALGNLLKRVQSKAGRVLRAVAKAVEVPELCCHAPPTEFVV